MRATLLVSPSRMVIPLSLEKESLHSLTSFFTSSKTLRKEATLVILKMADHSSFSSPSSSTGR